ncbi:putative sphingosine-1-phosphate phosphatase 2 [Scophthalmus maximus]|uniref:Putative sphingosine-1-phosphate phosphatase 2 n=1 Tax=Scophthalmus maximus TaxID=52904 RepID=A0A2U9B5P1_SCOMX|nr:sphingosine-1-phosphate phosphatase 2 isoform X1 [Scophthalmus maximus]AWO99259.1 putative sphingosine-1-phosphate phosphatase 2 [Scophthalmus maximus]
MLELLSHLHGPELVVRFQRRCGLFLVEPARHGRGTAAAAATTTRAPPEEAPVHADRPRAQLQGRWDHRDNNSNYKYEEDGCGVGGGGRPQYEVRNWPLHILFLLSSGLGHEIFYITCLPSIQWNLDPFLCRRLVNMWTLVMYVGQLMKDVLKLPRPLSPPVVKLETRVDAEYGLPSTHAMAATAISFTLLLSAPSRIQFQFEVGLLIAVTLSSLVCLSRIYTGMHSVLDVICGALISAVIMFFTYPHWETFDRLQLTSHVSPAVALALPLFLSYTYPELDHYSTTRGDTTTVLAVGAGCSVGYWVNERLGHTFEPQGVLPVPLPALTARALAVGLARHLLGVAALVSTRQILKTLSLKLLYSWYRVPTSDGSARRRREIEVPYKFATYTVVGLVNSILVNRVFILLGLL